MNMMKRISINANPEAKFSKDYFFVQKKEDSALSSPLPSAFTAKSLFFILYT